MSDGYDSARTGGPRSTTPSGATLRRTDIGLVLAWSPTPGRDCESVAGYADGAMRAEAWAATSRDPEAAASRLHARWLAEIAS